MDKVLSSIPQQHCPVYLDDILVHGSSFEAALESLRQVLERIRAAGLNLHPEKCHFMQRIVSFLGHRVGVECIGTMEEKTWAVTDWPTPTNQKQLKNFLGLASYYRWFVFLRPPCINCYRKSRTLCGLTSVRGLSVAFSVP